MTVEECLKDLRELFPDSPLSARHSSEGFVNYRDPDRFDSHARIVVSEAGNGAKSFRGPTLEDCMSQVRTWIGEQ